MVRVTMVSGSESLLGQEITSLYSCILRVRLACRLRSPRCIVANNIQLSVLRMYKIMSLDKQGDLAFISLSAPHPPLQLVLYIFLC